MRMLALYRTVFVATVRQQTVRRSISTCSHLAAKRKVNIANLLYSMPKEEVHLEGLMVNRMEKRKKRSMTQPATIYWQVLGSGSRGGPSSLFLHTDHRRYVFNCGEGSQRLVSQLSLSRALGQLEHVFITSKSWRYLGGLPGLCLSCRGAGAPDITIHGPPGCMELYEATKGFVTLFGYDVIYHDQAQHGVFNDGAVKVEEVQMKRSSNLSCSDPHPSWTFHDDDLMKTSDNYDNTICAYICSFSPRPGRLDVNLCVDLGVPPGPLLGKLKAGEDITLGDGRVVKASQVVAEAAPPSSYIVLDIPDKEYLTSLSNSDKLSEVTNLDTVFHFSPPDVMSSPEYQSWLNKLGPDVDHVILNDNSRDLGLPDVTAYQSKLATIRPDMFPSLSGACDPTPDTDLPTEMKVNLRPDMWGIQARSGLKLNVRPTNLDRIDYSGIVVFDSNLVNQEMIEGSKITIDNDREEYVKNIAKDLEYAKVFNPDPVQSLKQKLAAMDGVETVTENPPTLSYPKMTFLGTGSSVPSKYRNVTGILIETEPDFFIILDCGEGTVSQLVRLLGWDEAARTLRNLKGVFVSHLHADHHLGLINIVLYRELAFSEKGLPVDNLLVIGTAKMSQFLTYYHRRFESVLSRVELVKCEHLAWYNKRDKDGEDIPNVHEQLLYPDTMKRVVNLLGLQSIATCKAIHCPHAFSISLTTKAGYKLVYSGDTRPNPALRVLAARDGVVPDLLIHEATMEHFMIYDAMIKKHTTFTEACQEGREMGAKFTLLTHFSQRYAKVPTLDEIENQPNVGIASDMMTVNAGQLKFIPSIYPALKRFLWDYVDDLTQRGNEYKAKYSEEGSHVSTELDLDLVSPLEEKKQMVDKIDKRHEEKLEFFKRINRRKATMQLEGKEKIPKLS